MVEVPQPGPVATGHAAIREGLSDLLNLKPKFELNIHKPLKCDDIAILFAGWTMAGTVPDGNEVEMTGLTSDIVRRQPDGRWLIVIDNPVGGDGITQGA